MAFMCLVARLATTVAVALATSPATALRPYSCKGFISESFFLFPLHPLLTSRMPIFQALGLLNNAINKGVGVKDEATVVSRG